MFIQDKTTKAPPFEQLQAAYLSIELNKAKQEIHFLQAERQQAVLKITSLEEEIARLKEQLHLAQQRHFGKKRDVGEPLPCADVTEGPYQTVASYQRQKKKRKTCGRVMDLSQLPQHVIEHDLSDAEKVCHGCHQSLHLIEKERTAGQLEILPQRFYCAVHVRYKYGCHTCQTIHMAPKPPSPIPKALAGASVLVEVLVNKYHYHLPLYRQSKMMASLGVLIPDNTLSNWVTQSGLGLSVLSSALWEAILSSRYLQVDETPVKILSPDKKGYVWSYFAPLAGQGLIVFELSLTRSGNVADKRLASFNGLLQTDGYNGYQGLRQREGIEGVGCLTHAKRKFSDVVKITQNKEGIAAEAIRRLKPLYELEEKMREMTYPFHTRKRLRQKIAWPILKAFRTWLKKTVPHVPPKSQLANAIHYTLNQWPYLIKYVRHGMAEIDTNWVEDEIRAIALGRKNWLFMGHEESGKIHALFYSLVLSAVLNRINPRLYLHYLMTKVHDLRRGLIDPFSLLPHTIDKAALNTLADSLLAEAKKILNTLS
jgi:transposase